MFNVTRTQPGPDCSKNYRSEEVVRALKTMFYGKCYLCEDEVSDPVIEHFIPHRGDVGKKYDWNNLYYSCHRCNGIKGVTTDILDCCDSAADVSLSIKCLCPSVPVNDVIIEAQSMDSKIQNTANLLHLCYNADNTGIQGISKEALHEKLFEYYCKFIENRRTLKNRDVLQSEKDKAKERLINMINVSYPFSAFWKWHIKNDIFMAAQFPD